MQNPKSPPPIFCMVLLLSHVWILIVFFFQHLFRMKNIDNTNTRSTPSKYLNISPHPSCRSFQPVPNGEKGESTEKAERASELGQQGSERVEKHLAKTYELRNNGRSFGSRCSLNKNKNKTCVPFLLSFSITGDNRTKSPRSHTYELINTVRAYQPTSLSMV